MSAPRRTASHSSSASKSSLKDQHKLSRSLLPSPPFEQPHLQQPPPNEEAIESSAAAGEAGPDFQPFFTLIENPSTSEHHHPTVHYIFADDDPEIITEAACRALAEDEPEQTESQQEEETKLPPPAEGVREHYLLLDVKPGGPGSGYEVTKAHSLSSEWQVLNASISNAPTMDGRAAEAGEGLMLKIEGIGAVRQTEPEEAGRRKEKENLQQMVERFEGGLAEIRKMVDTGQEK
jgi:hypothetical protein